MAAHIATLDPVLGGAQYIRGWRLLRYHKTNQRPSFARTGQLLPGTTRICFSLYRVLLGTVR